MKKVFIILLVASYLLLLNCSSNKTEANATAKAKTENKEGCEAGCGGCDSETTNATCEDDHAGQDHSGTHTHDDGTVHSDDAHEGHDHDTPEQESFEVEEGDEHDHDHEEGDEDHQH